MRLSIRKFALAGAAIAAPVLSVGCDCNRSATCAPAACQTVVSTSVCSTPKPIVCKAATAVVYETVAAPVVSAGTVGHPTETATVVAVAAQPQVRYARPHRRGGPRRAGKVVVVETKAVTTAAKAVTAAEAPVATTVVGGQAIYYTPGGTPVAMYVPGPAATVVQDGAINNTVTQYYSAGQPVGASVHYTTGARSDVHPQQGETVVWMSGF